jgi:predicted regulator of Ras-like GTPase activity (Roadblock/LC7/MglB family)
MAPTRAVADWRAGGSPEQWLGAELRRMRYKVAGVHGSLVATNDGFLVAHDVYDLEPTAIAALAAASRSLASRTTLSTGRGQFREAIARGSEGYLAVYAAGDSALVAVIGTADLNIAMLHYQTRDIVERIATYTGKLATWPEPAGRPAAGAASAAGAAAVGAAAGTRAVSAAAAGAGAAAAGAGAAAAGAGAAAAGAGAAGTRAVGGAGAAAGAESLGWPAVSGVPAGSPDGRPVPLPRRRPAASASPARAPRFS